MKKPILIFTFFLLLMPITLPAQTASPVFVTLGTASGPVGDANRSQPANALLLADDVYLVDAGDGAFGQLIRAGIPTGRVKGLFISHLHFDHTGGVLAIIALRAQVNNPAPFTIYGPPGTRVFIDGLLSGMEPALVAGFGLPGQSWQTHITVHELRDGDKVALEGMDVTVAENNHYESVEDTGNTPGFISLSFRFDSPDRAIAFTGDTGASDAVASLARNTDILVSEMMDADVVLENFGQTGQNPLARHLRTHHMSPEQVADLANAAGVETLVITHFGPGISSPAQEQQYRSRMNKIYKGNITFASDLDRF